MGWELVPSGQYGAGKTQMYEYPYTWTDKSKRGKNSYKKATNPPYWTWQSGNLWTTGEVCIRYINDHEAAFVFKSLHIKTLACHSGGKLFWAWGAKMGPANGAGGGYYCYVSVTNDGGKTYQCSSPVEEIVADVTSSNMLSPGSGPTQTASFSNDMPYRDFELADCPVINPGGWAYIHLAASYINSKPGREVMKFKMSADEVQAVIEPAEIPCVWQFQSDRQWHLIPDWYSKLPDGWHDNKG